MSYQVQPFPAPLKGLHYNLGGPLIEDMEMTQCSCVSIDSKQNIAKTFGYSPLGSNLPLDSMITGFEEVFLTSGIEYLIAQTLTKIYYYEVVSGNWIDVSGSFSFTGDFSNLFSNEIVNDFLVMTNGKDVMKKWVPTTSITTLGGTPPIAKYIKKFKNYLVAGNTIESGNQYPQRIRWSDTGLPESWTPGAGSNAGYQDLTEGVDFITGIDLLGDWIIVFKERSIYAGYLSGTPGEIFAFDMKVDGTGCAAGSTIGSVKNFLFFMGFDNIYSFDGLNINTIGDNVKDEIFSLLNPAAIGQSFALVIDNLDEYHLFIPTGTNTYCDTEFIYNYRLNSWTRALKNVTRSGYYTKLTASTWDSAIGTWDAQTARWDDRTLLSDAPINVYGDFGGYVYQQDFSRNDLNGTPQDAFFDTKDFTMSVFDRQKNFCRLDVYGAGTSCDIYYSTDEGNTWNTIGTVYFSSYGYSLEKLDFRVQADRIRFRFANPRLETFAVRNYTLYWNSGGKL